MLLIIAQVVIFFYYCTIAVFSTLSVDFSYRKINLAQVVTINSLILIGILVIGGLFIHITKNTQAATYYQNKKETLSIYFGGILSFVLRIILLTTSTTSNLSNDAKSYMYYELFNFAIYIFSEFLPIALWTALKNPEDYIN